MNDITKSTLINALLEAEGAELESVIVTNEPSEAFSRRIRRLAERPEKYTKKHKTKRIIIILIAAAVILTGCTAIKPIRTTIANFIVMVFKNGSYVDKSTDKNGKDSITEFYSPAFIPEGYVLVEDRINKFNEDYIIGHYLQYKKGYEELIFDQLTSKTEMTLDTENAEIKTFSVNGIECMSSKNDDGYHVIWEQYGYRFILSTSADITEETAKKIIESVENSEFTNY